MTKRPFLHKWFTNGDDGEDCDEEGVTIDQNDPYLD